MQVHPHSLFQFRFSQPQFHLSVYNALLEEEDYIIVKWAQEDVETFHNLLNK